MVVEMLKEYLLMWFAEFILRKKMKVN